jgi:hypothetical protein
MMTKKKNGCSGRESTNERLQGLHAPHGLNDPSHAIQPITSLHSKLMNFFLRAGKSNGYHQKKMQVFEVAQLLID